MTDLNLAQDAIKAMRQYGHQVDDEGQCDSDCKPCLTYFGDHSIRHLAEEEYLLVRAALVDALDEATSGINIGRIYHLAQMRLLVLAANPDPEVHTRYFESMPLLVKQVSIKIEHKGRQAIAVLEPLYAMVGRSGTDEPYSPATVPKQPNWREATSELKLGEPTASPTPEKT